MTNPENHAHNVTTYILDIKMDLRTTEHKDVKWTELVQNRVQWHELCNKCHEHSGLKTGHFLAR
jgi:hypothetical protein